VSLVDLTATLYDMLGVDHQTSGVSMVPLMAGGVYPRGAIYGANDVSHYIREGDWKLIVNSDVFYELFNLSADPYEEHDLVDEYPDVVTDLSEKIIAKRIELKVS
ncbi:MAG: hypothetical protein KC535_05645, partial [Nanoarchaeota archaeon]|nr:hypothetical protein [Nanoarchaeota archaeon]